MASTFLDSNATFRERAKAVGISDPSVQLAIDAQIKNLGALAFSCAADNGGGEMSPGT